MIPFTDSPAQHLRSAYLRMHRVTNRAFHPYGMTADQYVLLRLLSERDGISQQELGGLSASDPTTIGRMLELLETKGLVNRKTDASDRRTRLVFLTQEGRDMAEQLYEVSKPIRQALESAVSPTALKQVLSGLSRLSAAMDAIESAKPQEAHTRAR